MDRSGAAAYVYAKASGMLARSFVGERAQKLFSVRSLSDLWALLFSEEMPAVPEVLLAKKIESQAAQVFVNQYLKLVNTYSKPDRILLDLIHHYDYENLKVIGAALSSGEKKIPELNRIEPFNLIDYSAWSSVGKMTAGSELSWYDKIPSFSEQQQFDTKLDIQFIKMIWNSALKLPALDREPVLKLLSRRYSMRNIIWVLRLKVYYKMSGEDIAGKLAFLDDSSGKNDILAGEALSILDRNVESWDDWASWKYSRFLNPHEDGSIWSVDPRWVEEASDREFYEMATRLFHVHPFSSIVLISWFFIKSRELDNIRTATESIRLNVDETQAMEAAGIIQHS